MKRFHFRLQTVLVLRQQAERQALEGYARAIQSRQRSANAVAQADESLSENWNSIRRMVARGAQARDIALAQRHSHDLDREKQTRARRLAEADREVDAALKRLTGARTQREGVERVRKRQWNSHLRNQERAEQKSLDELAGRRNAALLNGAVAHCR